MLYNEKWDRTGLQAWQKVLLDAADIIETRGWCQNHYGDEDDGFCAIGAMQRAVGYRAGSIGGAVPMSLTVAYEKLQLSLKIGRRVSSWNDASNRTKEEVIQALREAAQ